MNGGLNVYCQTSLDNDMHMVTLTFACFYDDFGGPPQPCMFHTTLYSYECMLSSFKSWIITGDRNITIDRASFAPGPHVLMVTISTANQGITFVLPFEGNRRMMYAGK